MSRRPRTRLPWPSLQGPHLLPPDQEAEEGLLGYGEWKLPPCPPPCPCVVIVLLLLLLLLFLVDVLLLLLILPSLFLSSLSSAQLLILCRPCPRPSPPSLTTPTPSPPWPSTIGCVYLTHILQKPCSTTTMAVNAIYEATAKKFEFASGKSCLATLF